MTRSSIAIATLAVAVALSTAHPASAQEPCQGYGPQTPRDISSPAGTNSRTFTFAPAAGDMNLCNIHTHTNAEHKGPGFSVSPLCQYRVRHLDLKIY